jgi:hypothetical protein
MTDQNQIEKVSISNKPLKPIEMSAKKTKKCPIRLKEIANENSKETHLEAEYVSQEQDDIPFYQDATGTHNKELAVSIVNLGCNASPASTYVERFNDTIQGLFEGQPQDYLEAQLHVKANSLFAQGMTYLSLAEKTDSMERNQSYINFATKLLRLHSETIETINRYKRKGEQRVVVQHQHVQINDGGKAVVNNMISEGGK